MIEVSNLEKHYTVAEKEPGIAGSLRSFFSRKTKTVKAVDGVSFSIAAGEMVGFLGANGAGKTTTLKMLSGLLHPTAGTARVAGFTPFERRSSFLKTMTLVMGQKQQLLWDLPASDSFWSIKQFTKSLISSLKTQCKNLPSCWIWTEF